MHHFSYVGGVLHAEGVSLSRLAEEVGTPFYCYATATLERHYRVLQDAFAGPRHADLLRHQGQLQPGRDRHACAPSGAGMDVVSEGELRRARAAGVPGDRIIFAGVGKTRAGDGLCARRGHPRLQRGIRARARGAERGRSGPGPHGRHRPPRQPRRRCQDARQDLHRQGGEQVRRALPRTRGGSMPRQRACRASRSPASTCTSAARSPTSRPSATPSCSCASWRTTCAAAGHPIRHLDMGGGLGVPYRGGNDLPPSPTGLCAGGARDGGRPRPAHRSSSPAA